MPKGHYTRSGAKFYPVTVRDPRRVHPVMLDITRRQNELRMSTKTLAERAGIHQRQYRYWRAGDGWPSLMGLHCTCVVLGLEVVVVEKEQPAAMGGETQWV